MDWLTMRPSQRNGDDLPKLDSLDNFISGLPTPSQTASLSLYRTPEPTPPESPLPPTPPPRRRKPGRPKKATYNIENLPETGNTPLDAVQPVRRDRDGLDQSNIMTGPRTRKKTALGQELAENLAHFAKCVICELDKDGTGYADYNVFHYTFAVGTQNTLYCTQIVPLPDHWGDLKHHLYRDGFIKAAHMEFKALKSKNTFIIVLIPAGEKPIPTRWVFIYKFDESGFLIYYKAQIVIRGDIEPLTGEETYAAILAFCVFRSLMALAAVYNLSTR